MAGDIQSKNAQEPLEAGLAAADQEKMNSLVAQIYEAATFENIIQDIEPQLLTLLSAERVTIYQRDRTTQQVVSRFKSGGGLKEIKVPLTTASLAGYVALTQKSLRIDDVYEEEELRKIHSNLKFNRRFDQGSGFRTRSVITVPIKHAEVLLGVLQFLNKIGGGAFSPEDMARAGRIADVLGRKFRYELGGTLTPYDYLVKTEKIKAEKLEGLTARAERESTPLPQLLISAAGLTPEEIGESFESYYRVPFVRYSPEIDIPTHLIKNVRTEYLRSGCWVPLSEKDGELVILIDDPNDAPRIMEIQRLLPAERYSFRVGFKEDILRFLGQGEGIKGDVDLHALVGKLQDEVEEVEQEIVKTVDENQAAVVQLVNQIIVNACREGASDIHIEPGKGKASASVRYRIDGICRAALTIPASHIGAAVARIKIMSALDISERRKPQDGKCALKYQGRLVELRVATLPTVNGEAAVLRILSSNETIPVSKLNLSPRNQAEVERLIQSPHGVFLVVGPTGSGKTTTLHAFLGHLNTPERKVWTAEDPVEITQPGLQQLQVQPKIGLTFAAALRSFLRADPDVIMIGEMRDEETAQIGIEASLTGHLVLSTLHTNSAAETVVRLLDLGVDPANFSDALLGVLAQRLVRTLCKKCREGYALPEGEYQTLMRYYGEEHFGELKLEPGKSQLYRARGCEECGGSGYKGRTGIHELLVASDAVKQMIYKNAGATALQAQCQREGMRTLMQDGIRKLAEGDTDMVQLRKVVAAAKDDDSPAAAGN